jgi:hypothetical protein
MSGVGIEFPNVFYGGMHKVQPSLHESVTKNVDDVIGIPPPCCLEPATGSESTELCE